MSAVIPGAGSERPASPTSRDPKKIVLQQKKKNFFFSERFQEFLQTDRTLLTKHFDDTNLLPEKTDLQKSYDAAQNTTLDLILLGGVKDVAPWHKLDKDLKALSSITDVPARKEKIEAIITDFNQALLLNQNFALNHPDGQALTVKEDIITALKEQNFGDKEFERGTMVQALKDFNNELVRYSDGKGALLSSAKWSWPINIFWILGGADAKKDFYFINGKEFTQENFFTDGKPRVSQYEVLTLLACGYCISYNKHNGLTMRPPKDNHTKRSFNEIMHYIDDIRKKSPEEIVSFVNKHIVNRDP